MNSWYLVGDLLHLDNFKIQRYKSIIDFINELWKESAINSQQRVGSNSKHNVSDVACMNQFRHRDQARIMPTLIRWNIDKVTSNMRGQIHGSCAVRGCTRCQRVFIVEIMFLEIVRCMPFLRVMAPLFTVKDSDLAGSWSPFVDSISLFNWGGQSHRGYAQMNADTCQPSRRLKLWLLEYSIFISKPL